MADPETREPRVKGLAPSGSVRPTLSKVEGIGPGMFRLLDGKRGRLAYAVGPAAARWVFLDGKTYLVDLTSGGGVDTRRHGEAALSSPMPATVVKINVEPGRHVARGDILIVLEAMKMELPVLSPREGTVRVVTCRLGELVQPGVPLLELE